MNDLNLLNKTELWINNITLEQANLTHMAEVVAQVLGLDREKVMVVDVRPDHITFDLVVHEVAQENIIGKERQLLDALSEIPGVHLTEESHVDSRGILGLICSQEDPQQLADTVTTMRSEIVEKCRYVHQLFFDDIIPHLRFPPSQSDPDPSSYGKHNGVPLLK